MTQQFYAGVDYSMRSPAVTLIDPDAKIVRFKYFRPPLSARARKKSPWVAPEAVEAEGWTFLFSQKEMSSSWDNQQLRYAELAHWCVGNIPAGAVCSIEAYAYGANGRMAHIGEVTEAFKWILWERHAIIPEEISPGEIKKFATKSGNAKKDRMGRAFFDRYKFWMHEYLGLDHPEHSPASDIVDSYWLARMSEVRGAAVCPT